MTSLAGVAFGPQIVAAAQRHRIDPVLLAAVAAQETGGPRADSGANVVGDGGHGHGVFQIDDRFHAFARTAAAMNPAKNADYAAGMLSGLLQKYGGNVRAALSAYNSGSPGATGTTTDWGNGMKVSYADSVLAHYTLLGGNRAALPGLAGTAGAARDAEMATAPDAVSAANELRTFATGAATAAATSSAAPSAPSSSESAALESAMMGSTAAMPCPTIPPVSSQTTEAQRAKSEAPPQQDYFADDGDAEPAGSTEGVS